MAAFRFEAADAAGLLERGVIDADSARHARSLLRERALVPLEVTPVGAAAAGTVALPGGRLRSADLTLATRQLASLLAARLTLEQALGAVIEQADRAVVRERFAAVRSEVVAGQTFSQGRRLRARRDQRESGRQLR